MVNLTATAESVDQARRLLEIGIDTLYIGEDTFGLRLPASFSRENQKEIVKMAHNQNKKVTVAVNAIMHQETMGKIPEYLSFLADLNVDQVTIGDPGVIFILQRNKYPIDYIYDGETLVTSARQVNFWAKKGAVGSVIAREVPFLELNAMAPQLKIYGEVLVYGATCIHQSKRPLVQNYFSYIDVKEAATRDRGLFLSEPQKKSTHYSIYEDLNGTHIFADNDINLMLELDKLIELGYDHWKLDGIFTRGDEFVKIAQQFVKAKMAFHENYWNRDLSIHLEEQVKKNHPKNRGLDMGFFLMDPNNIK